jgi:DNA-binding transcriptional regulator YdaS (Cro superfamily)
MLDRRVANRYSDGVMKQLTPDDRRRIADKVGVNAATLYQAMTGKGAGFSPAECIRIERESDNELRVWDLRPKDWYLIWPMLIGKKGAPPLVTTTDYTGPDRRSKARA